MTGTGWAWSGHRGRRRRRRGRARRSTQFIIQLMAHADRQLLLARRVPTHCGELLDRQFLLLFLGHGAGRGQIFDAREGRRSRAGWEVGAHARERGAPRSIRSSTPTPPPQSTTPLKPTSPRRELAQKPTPAGAAGRTGLPRSRSGDAGDGICGNRGVAGCSLGRRI